MDLNGYTLVVFKNGVAYNFIECGSCDFFYKITVPSNVKDNELQEYVEKVLQNYEEKILKKSSNKYYMESPLKIVSFNKGAKDYKGNDIPNGYTIVLKSTSYFTIDNNTYKFIEDDVSWQIIVKREEPTDINSQDNKTNIKLETDTSVVPEDTKLVAEKITTGESYNIVVATLGDTIDKFVLYDITLKSNGVKVQPNGKVKISIPIPDGFNKEKLVVYRINEDGTKVKYDVKIETIEGKEYATFETDHFSLYTLALDNEITNTLDNSTDNDTLDETPKTGNFGTIEIISLVAVISLIAVAGMIIKKGK